MYIYGGSFKKYIRLKLPIFVPPTPLLVPVRFTCMLLLNICSL